MTVSRSLPANEYLNILLIDTWRNRTRHLRKAYGLYNGRPVVRITLSKGSPCKHILTTYGMFTFLGDLCLVFNKMTGVPDSVLEETYWHFRKQPHFRAGEVERYVQEKYKKQDGAGNANRKRGH